MVKEVRLNDKLWFGKYKGKTIKDIINCDRNFIENLVTNNKITYNKNVIDYINESLFSMEKKLSRMEPRLAYDERPWEIEIPEPSNYEPFDITDDRL